MSFKEDSHRLVSFLDDDLVQIEDRDIIMTSAIFTSFKGDDFGFVNVFLLKQPIPPLPRFEGLFKTSPNVQITIKNVSDHLIFDRVYSFDFTKPSSYSLPFLLQETDTSRLTGVTPEQVF